MKRISPAVTLALFVAGCVLAQSGPSLAKDKTITGKIRGFECGDNCYLTIIDNKKAEQVGLCVAPQCQTWNEQVAMPCRYKGKRVTVTIGQAKQFDDSGNVMGEMMSFKKIQFLD